VAGGYLLHVYNPGLPEGYSWSKWPLLVALGALNLALGPLIWVVVAMQGPPRTAVLEVRPGTLKADRSIAGDRVVSTYSGEEVQHLFVDHDTLVATTRKGEQLLVAFAGKELAAALGTLIASRLWHPEGAVTFNDKTLGRRVFLSAARLRAIAAHD
jgi:hypothetical protein